MVSNHDYTFYKTGHKKGKNMAIFSHIKEEPSIYTQIGC
jgi:hypothetical protein